MYCAVHGPTDIVGPNEPLVWIEADKLATLERDLAECRAALRNVLDTRATELKAREAYIVASNNFTDRGVREHSVWMRAMVAASNAESAARAILAKGDGE